MAACRCSSRSNPTALRADPLKRVWPPSSTPIAGRRLCNPSIRDRWRGLPRTGPLCRGASFPWRYTKDDAPGLTDNERAALTALAYNEISRPDFVAYQVDAAADEAPRLARAGGLPLLLWTVTSQAQWERARADADNLIFEGFDA